MSDKEIRKEIITLFYDKLLDRKPDDAGMEFYVENDFFLETVYTSLKLSEEAEEKRVEKIRFEKEKVADIRLPITLAIFVKNVEDSVAMAINSVKPIVKEIVVLDTGSTDNSVQICKDLGALVYKCGFTNFGDIRTLTARLAREEWVLGLDADEIILEEDWPKFKALVEQKGVDIWGLPRKRWADLEMTQQLEKEVQPDWQYRFFRNIPEIHYTRRVHEIIQGSDRRAEAEGGPCIQHFQDSFKSGSRLKERNSLYRDLYNKDVLEGIEHKGKPVEDIDDV